MKQSYTYIRLPREIFSRFLFFVAVLLMTFPASAQDFTYTYEGQTLKYTVLDAGAKTCEVAQNYGCSGDLKIPEIASDGTDNFTVVAIGNTAFRSCTNLTTLELPATLQTIGENAFDNCSGLTGNLVIPNSVQEIGENAFHRCIGLNGKLIIGESVNSIGKSAFYQCTGFTGALNIPNSVEKIDANAFYGCTGFSGSLILPNSVKSIGDEAFFGCSNLDGTLFLPASLNEIGAFPFGGLLGSDCKFATVISLNPQPLECSNESYNYIFSTSNLKDAVLYVPDESSVAAYKASGDWKSFKDIKALNEYTIPPAEITLSPEKIDLMVSKSATIIPDITPLDITEHLPDTPINKTVSWKSSDESIVSVDDKGLVTAIKEGTATITATTTNNLTASCEVTVNTLVIAATDLTLNKTTLTLKVGETLTLSPTISPEDATDKTVTWSSSSSDVATVSASGVVTALKAGTATITASTANGLTATCTLTVNAATVDAGGIELNLPEAEVNEGESVQLTATVTPNEATDKTVTWTSSDATVASVNASGLVSALKPGTATITATTANGLKATCTIIVTAATVEAGGIELNLPEAEVTEGESVQLTATVTPNGATDKTVTWTSSDATVASVSAFGFVTALKVGTATITATTANGLKATCIVTVTAATIDAEGIELNLKNAGLTEGESVQLNADITPTGATDKTVTWTSSDATVASVSASGFVTALKVGTATITATTANGLKATCIVTVTTATIDAEGIELNLPKAEVTEGESVQLTATVTPTEVTDKTVTWTSSDATVATVNSSGLVSALKAGTATVTATTANGLKSICEITVKAKPSGIEDVTGDDVPTVRADGGEIVIADGAMAEVYSLTGARVAVVNGGGRFSGLPRGIYIVRIGGKSYKISL